MPFALAGPASPAQWELFLKPARFILVCLLLAICLLPAILLIQPRQQTPAALWQRHHATATPDGSRSAGSNFVRFEEYPDGTAALLASVTSYTNPKGQCVSLIAAVHVADARYFTQLQKTLTTYDVVLYELIMPRGMKPPAPGGYRSSNGLSWLQLFMRDTLKMQFQLDGIDYRADNFIHADLTLEEFEELQEARGESMLKLMFRSAMSEAMRKRDPDEPAPLTLGDLLAARNSPDPTRQYRLILGRQFASVDRQMAGLEGPDGSVIITERNKAALAALDHQLDQGAIDIAIYFGAGHMPGIEQGLLERNFRQNSRFWLTAWIIDAPVIPAASDAAR